MVAIFWLASVLLVPAAAFGEPTAADKETARAQLATGDRAVREKDFASALRAYTAADDIMHVPTTGIEVAKALNALGKLVEARDKYLQVSRIPVRPDEPAPFAHARTTAATEARHLSPRIPSIAIALSGFPQRANVGVFVDDEAILESLLAIPRKLNPGHHTVRVTVDGGTHATREVDLAEADAVRVEIAFGGPTSAEPAAPLPVSGAPAPVPDATEATTKAGLPVWSPVAFGVGGVGVVVGGITGAIALSRASSAKEHCTGNTCTREAEADIDASKSFGVISTGAFGVALVGAGIGLVGLWSSPRKREAVTVTPTIGAGHVGIRGQF